MHTSQFFWLENWSLFIFLIFILTPITNYYWYLAYARFSNKYLHFVFKQMLLYGDISSNTLDTFTVLIDEIYGSLLNNPLNQNAWPKLLQKDVSDKFYEVLENVAVVMGYLSNKTFLPLPMNVKEFTETVEQIVLGLVNKRLIHENYASHKTIK